jgi:hypothetical protein
MLMALAGCVSAPPSGSFVEYRDGLTPTTRTVQCEANYELVARDATAAPGPFGEHHIRKGGEVGFRREADGTLTAVAPGYRLPLPPGAYSWEIVRYSVPSTRERNWCEARQHLKTAGKVAGMTFLVGCTTLLVLIIAL